jgi:Ni/Co efflux regulator RcnB
MTPSMSNRTFAALIAAVSLAVPAAAVADSGHEKPHEEKAVKEFSKDRAKAKREHRHKHRHGKKATYVFKGMFVAPDTVDVLAGNAHVRKGGYVGQAVTFDFEEAKIVADDTNGDGMVDLTDVGDGDLVLVQARMAKGSECAMAAVEEVVDPLVARKLIVIAHAPAEEEEPVADA